MPRLLQTCTAKNIFHSDQGDIKPLSRPVTIKAAENLEPGQVIGTITATGLSVAYAPTATDGSQIPVGILADFVNASSTGTNANTPSLVYIGEALYLTDKLTGVDKQALKQLGGVQLANNVTHMGSGRQAPLSTVTPSDAAYTALAGTDIIFFPSTAAARTITLPTAASFGYGNKLTISTVNANTNNITIDGDSSETINGAATLVLTAANQAVTLVAISGGWRVVG